MWQQDACAAVAVDACESPVGGRPDVVLRVFLNGEHTVAQESVVLGGVVHDMEAVALLDDVAQSQCVAAHPHAVGHGEGFAVGTLGVVPAGEVDETSAAQVKTSVGIGRRAQPQRVVTAVEIEFADVLRQCVLSL